MLRAFRSLRSYDVERPFGPWLKRIVLNLASDELHGAARRDPGRLDDGGAPRRLQGRVQSAELFEALRALAQSRRLAIGRWVFPPTEPALAVPTAPAVTIDAQPRVATTGTGLMVTGSIVVRQAGERVTIEANPCGRGWRLLTLVETDESGN